MTTTTRQVSAALVALKTSLVLPISLAHGQTITDCDLNFAASQTAAINLRADCIEQGLTGSGGALEVCPRGTATSGYNDNALRTDEGTQGDGFVRVTPELRLRTIGTPYQLRGSVSISANRQFVQTANNYVDLRAKGRVGERIGRETRVEGIAALKRGHADRSNIEIAGRSGDLPNFVESTGAAGITYDPPIGFVSFGQRVRHKNFTSDPARLAVGQDATTYTSIGCTGTEFSKRIQGLVIGNFSYVDREPGSGPRTFDDNFSISARGQLRYRFTGVTSLGVGAGWLRSKTIGDSQDTLDTFVASAKLAWRPTDLTQVRFVARNDIKQTNIGSAGTLLSRSVRLRVSRSVHPQVQVGFAVEYATSDVQSSETKAKSVFGEIAVSYAVNEKLQTSVEYSHNRRLGQSGASSFTGNSIVLSLAAAY